MRVDKIQEGATKERAVWRAKINAMKIMWARAADNYVAMDLLDKLLAFADKRELRTKKKKGGL